MGNGCLFCRIAKGEVPTEFIYENDSLVVLKDIYPQAPVHLLIVPKKHIRSINELCDDDREIIAEVLMVAKKLAKKSGVNKSGYKLLFNVEQGGGQEIFHVHLHLVGGWR